MKNGFYHFVDYSTKKKTSETQTPEEIADLIEQKIREMMDDGEKTSEIIIDVPDDLSPEETEKFLEEIFKRLSKLDDEDDDE